jgi:TDG/mug DNA glycosylase family protein
MAQRRFGADRFGGRLFTAASDERVALLLEGAGFEEIRIDRPKNGGFWLWIRARRSHTLPDYVRRGLGLLVCGLNPSLGAANTGVPFVGPSNRFWSAATRAKLVERERDPWDALRRGMGFTDLVKRPTRSASELRPAEYTAGLVRLEKRVRQEGIKAICFVGLDGWRRAVDPKAAPGWIEGGVSGRPAYLMPSTSGRNAHSDLASLARHLRRAARGRAG